VAAINANIIKRIRQQRFAELKNQGFTVELGPDGRKATGYFQEPAPNPIPLHLHRLGAGAKPQQRPGRIGDEILANFSREAPNRVEMIYTKFCFTW